MSDIIRIDVDAILAAKAGKKAKYVPRFLVSYLKKIIHQDEVNEFLRDNSDKFGLDFIRSFMKYFNNSFEIRGIENLPSDRKKHIKCLAEHVSHRKYGKNMASYTRRNFAAGKFKIHRERTRRQHHSL